MKNSRTRIKTQKRRLHYLGIMAAAGLISASGGAPAYAQDYIVNPADTPSSHSLDADLATGNDIRITGESNQGLGDTATGYVSWDNGVIDQNLIFGPMDQAAAPGQPASTTLLVNNNGATVNRDVVNAGGNTGVTIDFGPGAASLTIDGDLKGGNSGISIVDSGSSPATVVNGATDGKITLGGTGVYTLNDVGTASTGADLTAGNNAELTITGNLHGAGTGVQINNNNTGKAVTVAGTTDGAISLGGAGAVELGLLAGANVEVDGNHSMAGLTASTNNSVYGKDNAGNTMTITGPLNGGTGTPGDGNTVLTVGKNDNGATKVNVSTAQNIVAGTGDDRGLDIIVNDGNSFAQTAGTVSGDVSITNKNTVDQAGSAFASLGKLTDGATLVVTGAVKVADVATNGSATILGTSNNAMASQVYLDDFTTGAGTTTLNIGANGQQAYVKYDDEITGKHQVNTNAGSIFDNSAGSASGSHNIDNGTKYGALNNADMTVKQGSTQGAISATYEHTGNTIKAEAGSTKHDTGVTITGDINKNHPTLTSGQAGLTIGNGASGLTVTANGDIKNNPAADFTLEVKNGSAFHQNGGKVNGTVVARNGNNNVASDLTFGLLDNAVIKTDDAILVNGTTAGSNNTIKGETNGQNNGLAVMAESGPGFGANTSLNLGNATLALTGNGNNAGNLALNMDSTNGNSTLDAASYIQSGKNLTVNELKVSKVGNHNAIVKGKDLTITNAVKVNDFTGNGRVVFDASAAGAGDAGINMAGGLDINTNNGKVDFIGNNTINTAAANPNNLKVTEVNINNGKFTVNGDALELGANTGLNLGGAVGFGGAGQVFNNANVIHTGGNEAATIKYDVGTFQNAKKLSVDGDTAFKSGVTIKKTGAASGTGIYAKGAVLNADMIMQSAITIEGGYNKQTDPAIVYAADSSGNMPSIVLDKGSLGSSVAAGTHFEYDGSAIGNSNYYQFRTVEVTQDALNSSDKTAYQQTQREMWNNFEYDGHTYKSGQGAKVYDKNSGTFTHISDKRAREAVGRSPKKWGKAYVSALMHYDPLLADYYGNGLFGDGSTAIAGQVNPSIHLGRRELIQAMGNTISAVMMVTGGDSLNPSLSRLNNNNTRYDNMVAQSAGDSDFNGMWVTPSFSYSEVEGNHYKGYDDFSVTNRSLTFGYDRWLEGQIRLGAFLGFNSGELDGDWQDIDSDTIQIGAYGQAQLPEGYNVNFGIGYSWHEFEASRDVTLSGVPGANQRIKSDFDGNTITASVEVNKTFVFAPYEEVYVKPSVGYTYVGTELDSYNERSNNSAFNLAQKVKGTDFDLHLFRLGADIGTTRDDWNLVGRVYYVGNAGDIQPKASATLRGAHSAAGASAQSFKIYGARNDRHMFNPGVSLKVAPDDCSTVSLDYDLLVGHRTETHNVNLNYKYEF